MSASTDTTTTTAEHLTARVVWSKSLRTRRATAFPVGTNARVLAVANGGNGRTRVFVEHDKPARDTEPVAVLHFVRVLTGQAIPRDALYVGTDHHTGVGRAAHVYLIPADVAQAVDDAQTAREMAQDGMGSGLSPEGLSTLLDVTQVGAYGVDLDDTDPDASDPRIG